MGNPFKQANRLWFHEGRTAKALEAYGEALRKAPMDPVIAFQYARALWSVDRFDEARFLLDQANVNRNKLNPKGQWVLDRWRALLQGPAPQRHYSELTPTLLDRDRLKVGPLPVDDWLTIADAANEREMYGLAIYAFERWGGVPIDAEDARDMGQTYTNRHIEESMLDKMYADGGARKKNVIVNKADRQAIPSRSHSVTMPPFKREKPPLIQVATSELVHPFELPQLPLQLKVEITPVKGRVGIPTTMVAKLSNPTNEAMVVNRRMLLNHVNGPGEIWLDVRGPAGYRNSIGFRVRAGQAPLEFFVLLDSGETVKQVWDLNDYESMHVPGEYVVTLTYHNHIVQAPDGRPMAMGRVSGTTCFYRND